ncbi:MAG: hypothetical protein KGL44_08700 [Sphingomonadales bacterium]|nr:hypothetical protein [Sphingomonadales bacterium]
MASLASPQRQAAARSAGFLAALRAEPLLAATLLAFAVAALLHGIVGLSRTHSFDETYTFVIASQPTFGGFVDWVSQELGGPLYYLLAWLWEKLVGLDHPLMRLPSLLALAAIPVLVLRGHVLDWRTRLVWAALLALWLPGLSIGTLARSYALLLLLGTAQAIAFVALLRDPEPRRAALWLGVSVLAVLTHYHAGVISLIQGLIFVARAPRVALRSWPAGLLLVPLIACFAAQVAFLTRYAQPGNNWYQLVQPGDLVAIAATAVGLGVLFLPLAFDSLAATARRLRDHVAGERPLDWPVALTVLSGVSAAVAVVAAGCFTPSFAPRYLLPYVPAILLGIACQIESFDRRWRFGSATLMLWVIVLAVAWQGVPFARSETRDTASFTLQPPSDWLAAMGSGQRLVLYCDNPTAGMASVRRQLVSIGRYGLERAGVHDPQVTIPAALVPGADPNRVIPQLAAQARASLIWSYDKTVPGTLGIAHPFAGSPPGWTCRTFGNGVSIQVACLPQSEASIP